MTDDPRAKLRLGGMALRNGLLVHGPTHWAAAVRTDAGAIEAASGRKPRLRAADPIPGVRGVVRLAEAFAVIPLVKRGLPEARLPFQDPGVLAVAAGASLGGTLLRRRVRGAGGEAAAAVVGFMPALFALRGGELAAYHGVEHKAIGAYEADDEDAARRDQGARALRLAPRRADARLQPRRHAAAAAARSSGPGPLAGGAVALASSAVAVEVFAWCERHAETRVGARAQAPGLRDPAARRHARAGRAPARGRPRGAGRDPARRRRSRTSAE